MLDAGEASAWALFRELHGVRSYSDGYPCAITHRMLLDACRLRGLDDAAEIAEYWQLIRPVDERWMAMEAERIADEHRRAREQAGRR